jgi:hypothetical protein
MSKRMKKDIQPAEELGHAQAITKSQPVDMEETIAGATYGSSVHSLLWQSL